MSDAMDQAHASKSGTIRGGAEWSGGKIGSTAEADRIKAGNKNSLNIVHRRLLRVAKTKSVASRRRIWLRERIPKRAEAPCLLLLGSIGSLCRKRSLLANAVFLRASSRVV